jgi:2-polyprenyl-3-methyl-5-hydroxy-6-metoxy-1,4-benzoquinol methylase
MQNFDISKSVVTGNYYDKYGSSNPLVRRMMAGFFNGFDDFVDQSGAKTAHEIGCGEGHLLARMLDKKMTVRGSDIGANVIAQAQRRFANTDQKVPLKQAPLEAMHEAKDSEELIVCCEVLEHVDDPDIALSQLSKLAKPYLLTSVPREPLWRGLNLCRGKYLSDFGNTPGHLNHWSKPGFLKFLNTRFEVITVATPIPWIMAFCRVRDN